MAAKQQTVKDAIIAADLIKSTAEAVAAALIKATSETTAQALQYIQKDISEIKENQKNNAEKTEQSFKDITTRDDKFTLKEDFVFWRNILLSGMSGSIVILISIIITLTTGKQ